MKKIYACLLMMLMLANICMCASAEEPIITQEDIAALQSEIETLRKDIDEAEALLKALERQYAYENRDRDVIFAETEILLLDGDTVRLEPTVTPIKDTAPVETELIWSTSDRKIARVDANGNVTGVNPGTTVITCTASDNPGILADVTVTVVKPVKKIDVSEPVVTLVLCHDIREGRQLEAIVTPADAYDPSVTWTSDDESVVNVKDGYLQAIRFGDARITISANDGSGVKRFVRVHVVQGAESISLDNPAGKLMNGESKQLYAGVGPRDTANKDVIWYSDDESVAIVTKNGLVRTVGPGECRIYAKTADGTERTCSTKVTVIQPVKTIKPNSPVIYLKPEQTAQPVFTLSPEKVSDDKLLFFSDNLNVARVDENGVITPVNGGSCNITVQANDGYGAKCTVTVHVEPKIPLEITGLDVHYTPVGLPGVTPEVTNRSFDTDTVSFTFAVRCTDAYGNELKMTAESSEFTWKEGAIQPGKTWADDEWRAAMPGCEMVWKVEAWLTGVEMADGKVIPVPEEEKVICTWEKY